MPDDTVYLAFEAPIKAEVDTKSALAKLRTLQTKAGEVAKAVSTAFDQINLQMGRIEQWSIQTSTAMDAVERKASSLAESIGKIEIPQIKFDVDTKDVQEKVEPLAQKLADLSGAAWNIADKTQALVSAIDQNLTQISDDAAYFTNNLRTAIRQIDEAEVRIEELRRAREGLVEISEVEYDVLRRDNEALRDNVANLEYNIRVYEDQVAGLKENVKWLEQYAHSHKKKTEEEKRSEEATQGTIDKLDLLKITLQDVVARYTKSVVMTRGEFQKSAGASAYEAIDNALRQFKKTGGEVEAVREDLIASAEKWAESEAKIAKRSEGETENIVKAWRDLFITLVGRSIIPDMMDAIEKQMVDRMREILKEHAKLVEAFALPGTGLDPAEITKLYKKVTDAVQEEQTKFERGVYEQQKETARIVEDTIKESIQGIDQFVYGIDFQRLATELERQGGQLANVSVKIKEEILGEHAKLVKQLFFIDQKPQDIEALSKAYNQVLQAIVDEQDLIRRKIIDKPIGTERIIRNMVEPFQKLREEYLRAYRNIVKTDWSKYLNFANVEKRIREEGKNIIDVIQEVNAAWTKLTPPQDVANKISTFFSNIATTVSTAVSRIPGILQSKLVDGVTNAMAKLPLGTQYYLINAVNEVRNAGDLFASAMKASIQSIKDGSNFSDVLSNWKPLVQEMAKIGKDAGTALAEGFKAQIQLSSTIVQSAIIRIAKDAGDRLKSEFKFALGGIADVATIRKEEDRLMQAIERARKLGLTEAEQRLNEERIKRGLNLQNSMEELEHIMKVTEQSVTDSLKNVGVAFQNLFSGQVGFGQFFTTLRTGLHQLDRSFGIGVEGANELSAAVAKAVGTASRNLSGYRRENEITDKSLQRLAKTSDDMGDTLKTQAQRYITLTQEIRKDKVEQTQIIARWLEAYDALKKAEDAIDGSTEAQERLNKATEKFNLAGQELAKTGKQGEIFGRISEHMEELNEKLKTGEISVIKFSDHFTTAGEDAVVVTEKLLDEVDSLTHNYPKMLSMLNRAVQDFEGQSKHFMTTLRDGGKISTENLQDMRLAYENMAKEMGNIMKLNLLKDPEALKFWQQLQRQILLGAENFGIMAQRATVVQQVKEKLYGTTRRVITGVQGLGQEAARHIPVIGEKAKLSEEQMNRLKSATQTARGQTQSLVTALGNLDPEFQSMAYSIGEVGRSFSSTMDGMRQVAEVKSASIIKALTAIKIAMVGIVGVFGSIIVSTGRLAAEVTTLGTTMEVVGKNIGYNTKYLWQQVEVLKETGITTREAINSITQFMRAGLPMEWFDPIQEMNYQLKDLARAAQEVAVAMGEGSSETFARFIDFVNTGNSNLLNQVGIMKNASQMYEEYAKAIGKTAKALSLREQREALMVGLMKEATALQGAYTAAMETANKQLGSMKRYIEELRLSYGKYFEPIIVLVVKRFNELLIFLNKLSPEFKQTITTIIAMATALAGLGLALQTVIPLLGKFFGFLRPLVGLMLGKFGLIVIAAGVVGKALYDLFMKIPAESEGIAGLVERIDTLLDSFGGIQKVLQPVQDWIRSFAIMVKDHFDYIYYRVKTFLSNINKSVQRFKEENPELIDFLQRARKVLSDLFTVVWRVVDKVLRAVELLLSGNWQGFFDNIKLAGKYILAWFLEFFNEVVISAFNWGKNIITAFVNGLITQARSIIPRVMVAIGQMISAFLEGHSPAKFGPLSKVDIWGEGIMEGFARGMLNKKIFFNEDMFQGMSNLRTKARLWGDNLIEVFTMGITGTAATAIGPAMGQVGAMIARFLEGHSPPEAGRLADIMDWGRNVFETFLEGFEEADFTVLDRALDLIRQRMERLAGDAETAGKQVAKAMLKAREIVAGAISEARSGGGALDLSALDKLMKDSFQSFGKDIGTVVSALFDAMKAEGEYKYLQDTISKAREARSAAIEELESEYESIQKQIEDETANRARLKGLIYNEELAEELGRQLEEANAEVNAAQNRINAVRSRAGKYGINILTWEEINANAQLELAEQKRDEVQSQIDYQEQIQREIERVGAQVEAEYKSRLADLESQLEVLRAINESTTKEEDASLKTAEEKYNQLLERSDYLSKLLEQRMKYEEELAEANKRIVDETANAAEAALKSLKDEIEKLEIEPIEGEFELPNFNDLLVGSMAKIAEDIDDAFKAIVPPDFTELFDKAFRDLVSNILPKINLEGGMVGFVKEIQGKVSEWWENFKKTPFGITLGQVGAVDFVETVAGELGEIIERLKEAFEGFGQLIGAWKEINEQMDVALGFNIGDILGGAFNILFESLSLVVDVASELIQLFLDLTTVIPGLLSGEGLAAFDTFVEDLAGIGEAIAGALESVVNIMGAPFDVSWDDALEMFTELSDAIQGAWEDIVKFFEDIWDKILDAILGPFSEADEELVGNSIIPDMINDIIKLFTDLPRRLLRLLGDYLKAAVALGTELYEGLKSKVVEITTDVVQWFLDVASSIIGTARAMFDAAVTIGTEIYNGFKGKIDEIINGVVSWFVTIGTNIVSTAATLAANAITVGLSVYNGFKSKIDEIITNVASWFVTIGSNIVSTGMTLWNNAVSVGQQVYNGFKGKIDEILNNVGQWFYSIGTNIVNTGWTLWNNAVSVGQRVYDGFKSKIDEIINNIVSWFRTLAETMLDAGEELFNKASQLAKNIFNAFYNIIFGENGLVASIVGWLKQVAAKLGVEDLLQDFYSKAWEIGRKIINGIKDAIGTLANTIVQKVKDIWNLHLKDAFQGVIDKIAAGINGIIDALNKAEDTLPFDVPGFPIGHITAPQLPSLDAGGIITQDIIARVHAGEIILPLDRLDSILRNIGTLERAPAFAPVMNFYPGSSPQQIMPAMHEAYDWYTEVARRG